MVLIIPTALFPESRLPHGACEVLQAPMWACGGIPLLEQCSLLLPKLSGIQELPPEILLEHRFSVWRDTWESAFLISPHGLFYWFKATVWIARHSSPQSPWSRDLFPTFPVQRALLSPNSRCCVWGGRAVSLPRWKTSSTKKGWDPRVAAAALRGRGRWRGCRLVNSHQQLAWRKLVRGAININMSPWVLPTLTRGHHKVHVIEPNEKPIKCAVKLHFPREW